MLAMMRPGKVSDGASNEMRMPSESRHQTVEMGGKKESWMAEEEEGLMRKGTNASPA